MDKYEIDELLNQAIMSKVPCFIVEGVDDICIYERLAKSANVDCEVYSADMISGLTGGNNAIITAMQTLESLPMPGTSKVHHFVVGIVDRDARPYRQEMPTEQSVFCLRVYSIESHFVSEHSIRPSIAKLTRFSRQDQVDADLILSNIESALSNLYYFSLEALKSATLPSYVPVVGYSANVGRRKDPLTIAQLQAKKSELDTFAASHSLTNSLSSMKEFSKGKWLLTAFAEELFNEISKLKQECKSSLISKCRMCLLDPNAACLFSLRDGYTKSALNSMLVDFIENPELNYIKDRMKLTASTSKIPIN